MTVVMHNIVATNPHELGDVWHLSLSKDGRGSPADADYDGGIFKMDGMSREKTVRLMRRLAALIEEGKTLEEIALP